MLLPQSLLTSLLASYKKEAFGQGAAHHGRPLRVGTRRAGAVGGVADARAAPAGSARPPGVADARASPRGGGGLHLGPAPPHARRLGLPGLSGSGHRELRVRGWGIEPSPRSFPTLTCDVLQTCKLGIGNGGPTDRHARPRVASGGHVASGAPPCDPPRWFAGCPPLGWNATLRRPQADRTHPAGSPVPPVATAVGGGALKGLGLWPGRLGKPLPRLSARAAKRAKCRAPPASQSQVVGGGSVLGGPAVSGQAAAPEGESALRCVHGVEPGAGRPPSILPCGGNQGWPSPGRSSQRPLRDVRGVRPGSCSCPPGALPCVRPRSAPGWGWGAEAASPAGLLVPGGGQTPCSLPVAFCVFRACSS